MAGINGNGYGGHGRERDSSETAEGCENGEARSECEHVCKEEDIKGFERKIRGMNQC